MDNFIAVKHLFSRAGFGIPYDQLIKLRKKKVSGAVDFLFEEARKVEEITLFSYQQIKKQYEDSALLNGKRELTEEEKELKKSFVKVRNQQSTFLNTFYMQKMMNASSSLRDKMTLLWQGHFACRSDNPYFAQQLYNLMHRNALGDFRTLLIEVSKSPAMLQYLNNQQNRKGKPNENFARELMELFTLGQGKYTENDIKESARAFTGWTYNKDWAFEFNPKFHDEGEKTFFGKTGNFDGEAIIDILLEKKETALFIASKVFLFFVSDTPHDGHIKELAEVLYKNKYNISAMMKALFKSDWFYDPAYVGSKIKSPVELLVGLSRGFFVKYEDPLVLIQFQSSMGQYLFNPPNVAGWPGGKNWIDSSSLMYRLKLPATILNNGVIDFSGKADPEDEAAIAMSKSGTDMANQMVKPKSKVKTVVDWAKFSGTFPQNFKPMDMAAFLLQPQLTPKITQMISDNKGLRSTAIEIASMPEYQLC